MLTIFANVEVFTDGSLFVEYSAQLSIGAFTLYESYDNWPAFLRTCVADEHIHVTRVFMFDAR